MSRVRHWNGSQFTDRENAGALELTREQIEKLEAQAKAVSPRFTLVVSTRFPIVFVRYGDLGDDSGALYRISRYTVASFNDLQEAVKIALEEIMAEVVVR